MGAGEKEDIVLNEYNIVAFETSQNNEFLTYIPQLFLVILVWRNLIESYLKFEHL